MKGKLKPARTTVVLLLAMAATMPWADSIATHGTWVNNSSSTSTWWVMETTEGRARGGSIRTRSGCQGRREAGNTAPRSGPRPSHVCAPPMTMGAEIPSEGAQRWRPTVLGVSGRGRPWLTVQHREVRLWVASLQRRVQNEGTRLQERVDAAVALGELFAGTSSLRSFRQHVE